MNSSKLCLIFSLFLLASCSEVKNGRSALATFFNRKASSEPGSGLGSSSNSNPESTNETGSSSNPNSESTTETGTSNNPITESSAETGASISKLEIVKVQAAIQAEPEYKMENSEINLLQDEGIITEADATELQALN